MRKMPKQFVYYEAPEGTVGIWHSSDSTDKKQDNGPYLWQSATEINMPNPKDNFNPDVNILAQYPFITQLGIQTTPGVRFYLNGDKTNVIEVGDTGIYEIDLTNKGFITGINFIVDRKNTSWGRPSFENYFYVIVDIMYSDINGKSLHDDDLYTGYDGQDLVYVAGGDAEEDEEYELLWPND